MTKEPGMPKTRLDPYGNTLPARMHFKHGAYWHVVFKRKPAWKRLGTTFGESLTRWAELEGGTLSATSVSEAWAVYSASQRGLLRLAERTQRQYRQAFDREPDGLLAVFGHMGLDDVRRGEVLAFLEARAEAGSPTAGNRDVAVLGALYKFSRERDWTSNEPTKVTRNKERPRHRAGTPEELAALSLAATPLWRALLALELRIGPRESEIRLLHRRHIQKDALLIERPKTGRASEFPWAKWPGLREIIDSALAAHTRPSVWVFPTKKGGPYSEDGFRTMYGRLCDRAGVQGLQFRDLRRTAAINAKSLALARLMLGHTTEAMTATVYRPVDRVEEE